jgi:predicted glycogen debranching enzyme
MLNPVENIIGIECNPSSNRNMLQFSVLRIRVRISLRDKAGCEPLRVMIRTNLNQARRVQRQIIDQVEKGQSYSTDFYDILTRYNSQNDEYQCDVLLSEVGYFEFKVRVESTRRREPWVKWADGPNIGISVTPLEYGRNNSIYCAFIRQFGENKNKKTLINPELENEIKSLEELGAYVIPPGGNFLNFMKELPFIIQEMGMRIIHLLPINPVPTSYGRMGMYGSPYATNDYFGIDHTYATFSRYKTIEDQFIDLTSTIHGLGAKVFLDMVINHAGWGSSIHFTHRHWCKIGPDRKIASPGAWGVIWGDLVELDYRHKDLWRYMADVFLVWCRRGIDGFRLDAGYMVPLQVWQYIISKVRDEFPNTLFLLEGLGGPWVVTEQLLTEGQMNWAYSELFQNYTRKQIVDYLRYALQVSKEKGVLVHYAETHDNDRLAKKGKIYTRTRLYLCAMTSFAGAWGFTNGVEWLATEKIDVHRNTGLNWGSPDNLVEDIALINRILAENPAFWERDNLNMIDVGDEETLAFTRSNADHSNIILCLINLNAEKPKSIRLDWNGENLSSLLHSNTVLDDLLLNESIEPVTSEKSIAKELAPGACEIYRLVAKGEKYQARIPAILDLEYNHIHLVYQILLSRFKPHEVGRIDQEKLLRQISDMRKFIALVNTEGLELLIKDDIKESLDKIDNDQVERYSAIWTFRESNKEFIISGDKWLLAHTFVPCTAYLKTSKGTIKTESIHCSSGLGHMSFFPPQPENHHALLTFNWKIERNRMIQRQWQEQEYPILSVASGRKTIQTRKFYPLIVSKKRLRGNYSTVLLTNDNGAVCQIPALPQAMNTKYDSLLSIVTDTKNPSNRVSLVKTVKETIKVGEKYFDLDESFLSWFTRYPHPVWEFYYDDGEYRLRIEKSVIMPHNENALYVRYKLREANAPINLICNCYLEYRTIHDPLIATNDIRGQYEQQSKLISFPPGVEFQPTDDLHIKAIAKNGEFIEEKHWVQNLHFAQDKERGLPCKSDMFAPGTFHFILHRGASQTLLLTAEHEPDKKINLDSISFHKAELTQNKRMKSLLEKVPVTAARKDFLVRMLSYALDQFIIHNGSGWQIMAGYPWLGSHTKDALHCVGGLLAAGRSEVAENIILSAAGMEKDGLLPDWLNSGPDSRTGIEASLRLFLSAQQYVNATGKNTFWDQMVDENRSLRDVLLHIYQTLKEGIANGPYMDQTSSLLYCPANFSWMNTTHPQATPRRGYPVEVQVLWYQILPIVAELEPDHRQEVLEICETIKQNFMRLYWQPNRHYLSDVLLTSQALPAGQAQPDTALRFNQLTAIEAGLVPFEEARKIIDIITRRLLVPAGIRSLAEDPLSTPLSIMDEKGNPLTDPRMPYQGQCTGDETARRIAYHNGTAWPWAYPSFIEARASVFYFSELAVKQALAFFEPLCSHLFENGIGTLSEMKDGNYPHTPRGCYAYALSVAETLRVYMRLQYQPKKNNHSQPQRAGVSGADRRDLLS